LLPTSNLHCTGKKGLPLLRKSINILFDERE